MRKIFLFMMVSLDGYFEGKDHDLSWHKVDTEFNSFAAVQMQEAGMILFGRRTYELMESFWPNFIPVDNENIIVRDSMDHLPKIVVSKTLNEVNESDDWQNVTLLRTVTADNIYKLKKQEGKPIVVLGSSALSVSLLELGLMDELRIMINPVVIGEGTHLFHGISRRLNVALFKTRKFASGNILMYYRLGSK
jgi:dihydrofolate reductase